MNYKPILDQIALISRYKNEIYIIDHSMISAEAAGHTGGYAGKLPGINTPRCAFYRERLWGRWTFLRSARDAATLYQSDLPTGIYYLKITTNSKKQTLNHKITIIN